MFRILPDNILKMIPNGMNLYEVFLAYIQEIHPHIIADRTMGFY